MILILNFGVILRKNYRDIHLKIIDFQNYRSLDTHSDNYYYLGQQFAGVMQRMSRVLINLAQEYLSLKIPLLSIDKSSEKVYLGRAPSQNTKLH